MYLRYSRAPKNSKMHAPRDESGAHFFFDSTLCLSGYCLHVERDGCRTSLNGRETKEQQRVGGCQRETWASCACCESAHTDAHAPQHYGILTCYIAWRPFVFLISRLLPVDCFPCLVSTALPSRASITISEPCCTP